MKRSINFITGITVSLAIFFGYSFAATSITADDIIGWLSNDNNSYFGYSDTNKLSVVNNSITNTSIKFTTPIIKDYYDEPVSNYILLYSTRSFNDILNDPDLLNDVHEKSFIANNLSTNTYEMTLNDNLNSNTIYYVVAVPRNDVDDLGDMSNEICFRLSDKLYGEGDDCINNNGNNGTNEGNGGINTADDFNLLNITCNWDGNTVTVSRMRTNNIGNLDIALYRESSNNFTKKGTVNASQQNSFSFQVNQSTTPIIKFSPANQEEPYKTYTCHRLSQPTPNNPTPNTPVKPIVVGPKENIIAVVIGAIVLFAVYKLVRRKAD